MYVGGFARDQFGHRNAFLRGFVRQHRAAHAVPDGPDARRGRPGLLIDFDLAALGQFDARVIGEQAFGVGLASDADQQTVEGKLALAILVLDRHGDFLLLDLGALDQGVEPDVQPLFLEFTPGMLGDIPVRQRQKVRQGLQQDDLGTQAIPHRAQFESDDAGADDPQRLGHLLEIERPHVVDDVLAVEGDVGDFDGHGAAGQNHVGGLQLDGIIRVRQRDFHAPLGPQPALAVVESDLVALEKLGHAAGQFFDHAVLAGQHGLHVDGGLLAADTMGLVVVLEMVVNLARVQQRLGRYAPHVEAGSTRRGLAVLAGIAVDAGGLQAQLRGPDRSHVAARTAPDYDYVESVCHVVFLMLVARGQSLS
jgi:hypothetical protein